MKLLNWNDFDCLDKLQRILTRGKEATDSSACLLNTTPFREKENFPHDKQMKLKIEIN